MRLHPIVIERRRKAKAILKQVFSELSRTELVKEEEDYLRHARKYPIT